jgi:hypothetical protein
MVQYACFRCGYATLLKSDMRTHLNRKNVCKPILRDIKLDDYCDNILKKEEFVEKIETPISDPLSSISCEYCKKTYKYEQNLSKHLKTCTVKKTRDGEESIEIVALNEQIEAYKSRINKLESIKKLKLNQIINTPPTNNVEINLDDEDCPEEVIHMFKSLFLMWIHQVSEASKDGGLNGSNGDRPDNQPDISQMEI